MSRGQQQHRRARIVARPRRQYWNSIPRGIFSRAGEVRATSPAGRQKESKNRAPAPNTPSLSIKKETSGLEEAPEGTASKNLRATASCFGSLVIADQELRQGSKRRP